MELPKAYNPREVEDAIYKKWEDSGLFNPDKNKKKGKEHFSMVLPPPNVTGILHVGHAVMLALQDIMTRFHRMRGDDTLWLPGTDHAAIATQTKVEKILKEKGQSRHSLGREKFLVEVDKFVGISKDTIHRQIRKMGCSLDWSREAYTLDDQRSLAVRSMFKKMYDDGLIYRGLRVVNWCPRCSSTLADDEVEYKSSKTKLYWIKYGPFVLATTRPETKLGDTAVAVNPKDMRYKKMIGKKFMIPGVLGDFEITVVADNSVDMNFGSGAIKVTPAHSFVDYEIAQRNNIKMKQIIDEKGCMMENCGKYAGMTTQEAREAIVKDMEKMGLIDHIDEDYENSLSICYRCGTTIEPIPSKQWFVSVNTKFKIENSKIKGIKSGAKVSLKDLALAAVKNGQIKILPERFEKTYFHWMNDLRDWCISRQIWFGHQIPVWYKGEEIHVGLTAPKGDGWKQDPDTLDTWFSSGLWTFSTLGWPDKKNELARFHPTSVLETGYDILFFWVARMILMTTYALGEIPFETVYLHGLVRDEQGRKMSKSLGNTLDPLVVSDKYGTDAVRLSLILGTSPGNDVRLSEEKIAGFRNFTNKLWNIGRFVLTNKNESKSANSDLADKWITSKLNNLILEVTDDLQKYRFSEAGEKLREFTWNDFADWYIEINKIHPNNSLILNTLYSILKLWHPFMPYVTEELWKAAGMKDLLMIAEWPKADKKAIDKKAEKEFEILREAVVKMRNMRAEHNIPPAEMVNFYIETKDTGLLEENIEIFKRFARGNIQIAKGKSAIKEIRMVASKFNQEREAARLNEQLENKKQYLASLDKKLNNQDFINRAPQTVIDGDKLKYNKTKEEIANLERELKKF